MSKRPESQTTLVKHASGRLYDAIVADQHDKAGEALVEELRSHGANEGDLTGRGQPVKSAFDPLEPIIDIPLNAVAGPVGALRQERPSLKDSLSASGRPEAQHEGWEIRQHA